MNTIFKVGDVVKYQKAEYRGKKQEPVDLVEPFVVLKIEDGDAYVEAYLLDTYAKRWYNSWWLRMGTLELVNPGVSQEAINAVAEEIVKPTETIQEAATKCAAQFSNALSCLPDSGARKEYSTGAVRDASAGKGFPHMIPPLVEIKLAKRFEDGAGKYSPYNWMKGIPLSHYADSLKRHTGQWLKGDITEDHVGAILWNISCAAWTEEQIALGKLPKELDDLPFRNR